MNENISHTFAYGDLRQWIAEAEKLGELKRLKSLSWEREIGMVTTLLQRSEPAPCALFEDIPGVRPGFRVLANFFGGKRANVTLGFSPGMTRIDLSDAFLKVYNDPARKPIPHQIVETGPIFENVITGDDVDLNIFPSPKWHEEDGGRYIGTGCYSVTRDPDDGWLNQGTYRVMVHDAKTVGIYISPGKHGRMHRDKYAARGERMPMAIVLGGNPMQFLLTGADVPYGLAEYDVQAPDRVRARQNNRSAFPPGLRDCARGLDRAGRIAYGRTSRRMDGLLRFGRTARAGDACRGDLSP